jgi:DNA-binding XRE family transcriptional regulator
MAGYDMDCFERREPLNEKLKAAREERGWSIPQAASQANVTDSTWRNWEVGGLNPSIKNIEKLSRLLRKSREELGF